MYVELYIYIVQLNPHTCIDSFLFTFVDYLVKSACHIAANDVIMA